MNKFFNIAVAIAVSSFIATNLYLLFSEKSVISKSLYVSEYERMTVKDYRHQLSKETLVAPLETYTVYLEEGEAVNTWLVSEGDIVTVGQELALLNTERAKSERELWEAEREALREQEIELNNMVRNLESARSKAKTNNDTNVNRKDGVTEVQGKTTIEIGLEVGFKVDVTQEGSYSQAVSAIEQQLAEVSRQLVVLNAQLEQSPSNPALISPAEGVVSNVTRHGSTLSIDIFSLQKVLVTYVMDDEWQEIKQGQRVEIKGKGIDKAIEGTILSVSSIPAKDDDSLSAYKELESKEAKNPLAYYEVKILPEEELETIPFSGNAHGVITKEEALGAVGINEKWLRKSKDKTKVATILDESGKPTEVTATTSFTVKKQAVVTEGIQSRDIALHNPALQDYEYAPNVFLSFPKYMPTKKEWKSYGWRNYLEAMIMK